MPSPRSSRPRALTAVWLAGSHARADAVSHSDIDIGVIAEPGDGPAYRLDRRDGHLLSVAWTTAEATRASFDDPAVLGAAVPGWRGAVLLHDPEGIAAALQREAQAWDWEPPRRPPAPLGRGAGHWLRGGGA